MSRVFDLNVQCFDDATMVQEVLMTNPTALCELERYWKSLHRVRGVPMRRSVDPVAIAGLEDVFILERVAPSVARIRVSGRNIAKLLCVEPRGLPITTAFVPQSRPTIAQQVEAVFSTPGLVEIELDAPRAVGQPKLHGRLLLLPLRDDHGRVSRALGGLVMSGVRGIGGRRFSVPDPSQFRFEPTLGLRSVTTSIPDAPAPKQSPAPDDSTPKRNKAKSPPALRLVVSNT